MDFIKSIIAADTNHEHKTVVEGTTQKVQSQHLRKGLSLMKDKENIQRIQAKHSSPH